MEPLARARGSHSPKIQSLKSITIRSSNIINDINGESIREQEDSSSHVDLEFKLPTLMFILDRVGCTARPTGQGNQDHGHDPVG